MNDHAELLREEDCLLLIIDMQNVLLDPCEEKASVAKNCAALIDIARLFEIPVIMTVHNAPKLGEILPDLAGRIPQQTVYNKVEFNCFENEAIAGSVMNLGRKTLLLAGIEGHVCIMHTGLQALRLGYRLHVISDAVTSRTSQNKDLGLRRLERAGAIISSTEMMVFELLKRGVTDQFRKALPIIKNL